MYSIFGELHSGQAVGPTGSFLSRLGATERHTKKSKKGCNSRDSSWPQTLPVGIMCESYKQST